MSFERYFLFILLGCWIALSSPPALANGPVEQAVSRVENSSKRKQRKSRLPLRSGRKDDDLPPQVHGRSAGSRGCIVETATDTVQSETRDRLPALMLLAPLDSIAQTQSPQPLLAWYLRDNSPNPFIFRLYEVEGSLSFDSLNDPRQPWTLLAEVTLPSNLKHSGALTQKHVTAGAGISTLELSSLPESPKLRAGRDYVWQIEMICDPERPSRNLFAQAPLKMVVPAQQDLAQPNNATEIAELLGQGLWQDALGMTIDNSGRLLSSSAPMILNSVVIDQAELEALQQAVVRH